MRLLTFLTPDGSVYVSTQARDVRDLAVPDQPTYDHTFNREAWAWELPVTPPETVKAEVVAEINQAFESAVATLQGDDPPSAASTYSEQRAEAEAWAADNTAPTPMLDTLAAARRIDKAELVRRVLAKSILFKQASGLFLGQQQALMDDVNAIMAHEGLTDALKVVALQELTISIGLPDQGE